MGLTPQRRIIRGPTGAPQRVGHRPKGTGDPFAWRKGSAKGVKAQRKVSSDAKAEGRTALKPVSQRRPPRGGFLHKLREAFLAYLVGRSPRRKRGKKGKGKGGRLSSRRGTFKGDRSSNMRILYSPPKGGKERCQPSERRLNLHPKGRLHPDPPRSPSK